MYMREIHRLHDLERRRGPVGRRGDKLGLSAARFVVQVLVAVKPFMKETKAQGYLDGSPAARFVGGEGRSGA